MGTSGCGGPDVLTLRAQGPREVRAGRLRTACRAAVDQHVREAALEAVALRATFVQLGAQRGLQRSRRHQLPPRALLAAC
jgi:hypothetical protein